MCNIGLSALSASLRLTLCICLAAFLPFAAPSTPPPPLPPPLSRSHAALDDKHPHLPKGMSTASLPRYSAPPDLNRIPSYTAEPQAQERRLAHTLLHRPRPTAEFLKQDRKGIVSLRLSDQLDGAPVPTYGVRGPVEGVVELAKTDGVQQVAVKVRRSVSRASC